MDVNELQEAYANIMGCVYAEDVFGSVGSGSKPSQLTQLKKTYKLMSKVVHPDKYEEDLDAKEMAGEAFKRLNEFYGRGKEKIEFEIYGKNIDDTNGLSVIETRKRKYGIITSIAKGDLSTVYGGTCVGGEEFAGNVVVKIFGDTADNDLAMNEIKVLELFNAEPSAQSKHLPAYFDKFKTNKGKHGTIFRKFDGKDLYSIRETYPDGVDRKEVAWMLERLLSALGYAHSKGVLHGNINPSHWMINGNNHNSFLLDWCYAVVDPRKTGDKFKVFDPVYSAPEVEAQRPIMTSADLFSVGKCVIYLLGGDIKTNKMPSSVEEEFQRFIKFFVMKSPRQRARDAWEMYHELVKLRKKLWPKRGFKPFKM